jgi:hypothetical protein
MANRVELQGHAALALGWRRDVRALGVLEDWITMKRFVIGGKRYPEQVIGRLGGPGYAVHRRTLAATLAAHPDPPQYRWNEPDRSVHNLLQGLPVVMEIQTSLLSPLRSELSPGYPWAQEDHLGVKFPRSYRLVRPVSRSCTIFSGARAGNRTLNLGIKSLLLWRVCECQRVSGSAKRARIYDAGVSQSVSGCLRVSP